MSLNSQFIVVLDGTICFSVQFCDNSLLVLKMRFQAFCFASKEVRVFSSDPEDINVVVINALLSKKAFIYLIFSQNIWGNVHYVPEINLIS